MKLVITMSRRYGTGASKIARDLADKLQVPLYNKEYFENALEQQVYESETDAIRELANEPCIILGRCACEILKDRKNVLNVYVTAEREDRIRRVMELFSLDYEEAKEFMEKNDKSRADYYHEHTGKAWGDVNDYHLILDRSELGLDNCADVLVQYLKRLEYI